MLLFRNQSRCSHRRFPWRSWFHLARRPRPDPLRQSAEAPENRKTPLPCRDRKTRTTAAEVSPQHDRQAHRLPAIACLGINRLYQRQQLRPRNHLVHVVKKQLPFALTAKPRKTRLRRQCLLKTRHSLHSYSLINSDAACELVQRLLRGAPVIILVAVETGCSL